MLKNAQKRSKYLELSECQTNIKNYSKTYANQGCKQLSNEICKASNNELGRVT